MYSRRRKRKRKMFQHSLPSSSCSNTQNRLNTPKIDFLRQRQGNIPTKGQKPVRCQKNHQKSNFTRRHSIRFVICSPFFLKKIKNKNWNKNISKKNYFEKNWKIEAGSRHPLGGVRSGWVWQLPNSKSIIKPLHMCESVYCTIYKKRFLLELFTVKILFYSKIQSFTTFFSASLS